MTTKDDPINPIAGTLLEGLTKQEFFAAIIMAGTMASPHPVKHGDLEAVANQAVSAANFLITVLNSRNHSSTETESNEKKLPF